MSDKQSFHFTKCLLACGGVNQSYGVEGVKEFAISFKSIEDAKKIQAGIKKLKQSEYPGPKPIVIVGGGIEGVEVLGELLKIINKCDNIPVYLIDSKAKLLGGLSDKVHKKIASKLPS